MLAEAAYARKDKLIKPFRASSSGTFDNISWDSGDVGTLSKVIEDRHGFKSRYVRFKGLKTARLIPVHLCDKWFEETSDKEVDTQKWANSEKGGTKVDYGSKSKRQFNRKDIEKMVKESHMATELNEEVSIATPHFTMRNQQGKWIVAKWKGVGQPSAHKNPGNHTIIQTCDSQQDANKKRNGLNGDTTAKSKEGGEEKVADETKEKKMSSESVYHMVDLALEGRSYEFTKAFEEEMGNRINDSIDNAKNDFCASLGDQPQETTDSSSQE
jgi:hypothetical protein